jgi:hypothetical protein
MTMAKPKGNINFDVQVAELLRIELLSLIDKSKGWFGAMWLTEQVMKKFQPNVYSGKKLTGIELQVTQHLSHQSIKRLATDIFREQKRIQEGYYCLPYYLPIVRDGESGFCRLDLTTDAEILARIQRLDLMIDSTIAYRDELFAYYEKRIAARKKLTAEHGLQVHH